MAPQCSGLGCRRSPAGRSTRGVRRAAQGCRNAAAGDSCNRKCGVAAYLEQWQLALPTDDEGHCRGVCISPAHSSRWILWRSGCFPSTCGVSRGKSAPQAPRITASGGTAATNDVTEVAATVAALIALMEKELERRRGGRPERERRKSPSTMKL